MTNQTLSTYATQVLDFIIPLAVVILMSAADLVFGTNYLGEVRQCDNWKDRQHC